MTASIHLTEVHFDLIHDYNYIMEFTNKQVNYIYRILYHPVNVGTVLVSVGILGMFLFIVDNSSKDRD